MDSLAHTLEEAALAPQSRAFLRFYVGDDFAPPYTYAQLYQDALAQLARLQALGATQHSFVVLQIEAPQHFVPLFWACILGGITVVPLPSGRSREQRRRVEEVLQRLPSALLISDVPREGTSSHTSIAPETLFSDSQSNEPKRPSVHTNDLALVQFSSGSTGNPKGVTLTHAQLLASTRAMLSRANLRPDPDSSLSWMPLSHDMGLVGFHIAPIVAKGPQHLLTPMSFLRRPASWLEAIHRTKSTATAAPSFGLEYALTRIPERAEQQWDLSSLRLLFVGSDPISVAACERFLTRFSTAKLRNSALYPVYGLAEATLGVTFPPIDRTLVTHSIDRRYVAPGDTIHPCEPTEAHARRLVSLGLPLDGLEVRVVDEQHKSLPDGTIGAVEVRGTSVTPGYLHNDPPHEQVFSWDGWFRTGDQGFLLHGELTLTGRARELVIVAGSKVHLHDIDRIVSDTLAIPVTDTASCILPGERLVVCFRASALRSVDDKTAALLRNAVLSATGAPIASFCSLRELPRTTSGKARRDELSKLVLARDEEQLQLVYEALRSAGLSSVAPNTPFFEAGLNSLTLVQVATFLSQKLQKTIAQTQLLSYPTPALLAASFSQNYEEPSQQRSHSSSSNEPIAIIGMAIRLPNAEGIEEVWHSLQENQPLFQAFPDARSTQVQALVDTTRTTDSERFWPGSWFHNVSDCALELLGLSAQDAALIHPAQRMLFETVQQALRDGELSPEELQKFRTGLFTGQLADLEGVQYRELIEEHAPQLRSAALFGNLGAFAPGRIAHRLDLHGPVLAVDTACSSSLVALLLACDSLRKQQCDLAIAAAARVSLAPLRSYALGIESQSKQVRPFASDADGTLPGEGSIALVLQPLSAALRQGRRCWAVIRGGAIHHDGRSIGISAPNPQAQRVLLEDAWQQAQIHPSSLSFIEAHGTATRLGDAAELQALLDALHSKQVPSQNCALSLSKSTHGHLFEAAGLLGVAHAALSLWHRKLRSVPYAHTAAEPLRSGNCALFLPERALALSPKDTPLRAGISSFGMSGTIAHVVLEESPLPLENRSTVKQVFSKPKRSHCWLPQAPTSIEDPREKFVALIKEHTGLVLHGALWQQPLLELGLDSIAFLQLRIAIENAFACSLDDFSLYGPTANAEQLFHRLLQRKSQRSSYPKPTVFPAVETTASHESSRWRETSIAAVRSATDSSRQHTEHARKHLATARGVAGFRPSWKEAAYPLVASHAKGAYLFSIDGRRYLDLSMGFGVCLFGHNPDFISDALTRALRSGFSLGPMASQAGLAAELLCSLTGHERATFLSSGTEAVMVALRIARARTGRQRIALFSGSFHGQFDGVLAAASSEGSIPLAPGTPVGMVQDVLVLPYGTEEALRVLREHMPTLAAVLVEPIQSRNPSLQPKEFLQSLRTLTQEHGTALLFDEVITGFRLGLEGAAELFQVQPDLSIYGKILAGGLSVGAIAGRSHYLDAIDGGAWNFGDDSLPSVPTTFVAGTWNHHPLTMTAVCTVLSALKAQSPELQTTLSHRTEQFCHALDQLFQKHRTPFHTARCASFFRIEPRILAEELFPMLLARGVYVWEGRTCFLSTAHSDEDLQALLSHFDAVLSERENTGIYSVPDALLEAQQTIDQHPHGASAATNTLVLSLDGPLALEALETALYSVANEHEALRLRGWSSGNLTERPPSSPAARFSKTDASLSTDEWLTQKLREAPTIGSDLPALSLHVRSQNNTQHTLAFFAHRLVVDGWSLGLLAKAVADKLYANASPTPSSLSPCFTFWRNRPRLEKQPLWIAPARVLHRRIDPAITARILDTLNERHATLLLWCIAAAVPIAKSMGETHLRIPRAGQLHHASPSAVGPWTEHLHVALPHNDFTSLTQLAEALSRATTDSSASLLLLNVDTPSLPQTAFRRLPSPALHTQLRLALNVSLDHGALLLEGKFAETEWTVDSMEKILTLFETQLQLTRQ